MLPGTQESGVRGPTPYASWREPAEGVLAGLSQVAQLLGVILPAGGSNSWALGPSRTVSGKPMLTNDPHLSHSAPGTRDYQNALPEWKEGQIWPVSMEEEVYCGRAMGTLRLNPLFELRKNSGNCGNSRNATPLPARAWAWMR